jgi:hypothetical protein
MSKGLVKKDLEGTLKDLIKIQKNFIEKDIEDKEDETI